jgi:hypothetical protein
MPKAPSRAATRARNTAMRADRARGWTFRQIASHYAVSLQTVHRAVADVHVFLPNKWHRARLPAEPPPPVCWQALYYRTGSVP